METNNYRYPGLQPFKLEQANIFYGREKEIEEFYRFVLSERLIVLYAKSGMGKSSLLNAGVIPKIKKEGHYKPVSIRFKSHASQSNENPIKITQRAISGGDSPVTFLDELMPNNNSLWHEVKEQQIIKEDGNFGIILVFDQFEELFTYPDDIIKAFKEQLAELLFTQIPQNYRDVLREKGAQLTETQREKLHEQVDVRVVLAIRSDRLEQLKQISDSLPIHLHKNCYELVSLTRMQAEDAILNPAYKRDDNFASPVFDYEDEAIEAILNFLTDDNKDHIESFQLQILCQSVERKVIETGIKRISRDDLGNIETVYENYYEDELESIKDPTTYEAAKIFIEDGLLFDDEKEPRRLSLYEGQIERDFGISKGVLDQLVNCRLLRAELSPLGGLTYELSHDTLLTPVQKSKRRRDEIIKAKEQAAENARKEAEMAEKDRLAALRELEYKEELRKERRYRSMFRYTMIAVVTAVAIFFSGAAYFINIRINYARDRYLGMVESVKEEHLTSAEKIFDEINGFNWVEHTFWPHDHKDLEKKYKRLTELERIKEATLDLIKLGDQSFFSENPKFPEALNYYTKAKDSLVFYKNINNSDSLFVLAENKGDKDKSFEKIKNFGIPIKDSKNVKILFQVEPKYIQNTEIELNNRVTSILKILVGEFRTQMRNAENFEEAKLNNISLHIYGNLFKMLPTAPNYQDTLSNKLEMGNQSIIEYINKKKESLSNKHLTQ
jgi:hypothetical protein